MSRSPTLTRHHCNGFTIVEVIVAIVLLTVALLALEGSAAFTLRDYADATREYIAATRAETLREMALGSRCSPGGIIDSASGVVIASSAAIPMPGRIVIQQQTTHSSRSGIHTERYAMRGRCY